HVLCRFGNGSFISQVYPGASYLPLFGCDQDNAIGATGAIEGGCTGIFQDGKAGDVVHVETGQVIGAELDVVHQDQRAGAVPEGSDAPDKELGVVASRLASPLEGDHP